MGDGQALDVIWFEKFWRLWAGERLSRVLFWFIGVGSSSSKLFLVRETWGVGSHHNVS